MITAVLASVSTPSSAIVPGDVLINEVAFKESSDWVEFYVLQAANYEGLRVYEGTKLVKEFPKITASAGDYIVLHFNDLTSDENDTAGKGENGYWDIYTTDTGLTGTDNIVQLKNPSGDRVDVVIWANDSGKFTGNQTEANGAVSEGHWDAGAVFSNTRDSDAWTDILKTVIK